MLRLSPQVSHSFINSFICPFTQGTASPPALCRSHLSAVQPSSLPARGGRAHVTAVSAAEAAGMLAERFAAPASPGVAQLLRHVAAAAAAAASGGEAQASGGSSPATAGAAQQEALAAALASAPERAAAVPLAELQPGSFVPTVAGQLLEALAADSCLLAMETEGPQQDDQPRGAIAEAAAAAAAATAFVADVLARFCRRGHQQLVAAALLRQLRQGEQPPSTESGRQLASGIVAAMPDSAALDKLLEAALKQAAAAAVPVQAVAAPAQDAGGEVGSEPSLPAALLALDAPPASDPAAQAAAAVLSSLLPPAVWRARADARLLLTVKLLVQQQRRLLPLPALRGLLLFLQRQPAAAGAAATTASDGGSSGGWLPEAAARVAQLWGDPSAVQRLSPQQQAYLTAALCCSLRMLERRELEGHPQLLQLLLAGITARLDSPLLVSGPPCCTAILAEQLRLQCCQRLMGCSPASSALMPVPYHQPRLQSL